MECEYNVHFEAPCTGKFSRRDQDLVHHDHRCCGAQGRRVDWRTHETSDEQREHKAVRTLMFRFLRMVSKMDSRRQPDEEIQS